MLSLVVHSMITRASITDPSLSLPQACFKAENFSKIFVLNCSWDEVGMMLKLASLAFPDISWHLMMSLVWSRDKNVFYKFLATTELKNDVIIRL